MGGRVHVCRRENSRNWQCSTYLAGENRRTTTKEDSLSHAKEFAEDWYLVLRGKQRAGEILNEKTFKKAADQFTREYEAITAGHRNAKYVQDHKSRLKNTSYRILARWAYLKSRRVKCRNTDCQD